MKVLVMGAGVIGMTTAYFLHRAGHEVTVIDAEKAPAMMTTYANGGHLSGCNAAAWSAPGVPLKMLKWLGQDDAPLLLHLRWDPQFIPWGLRFLRNCTAARYRANTEHLLRIARYSNAVHKEMRAGLDIEYDLHADGILNLFRTTEDLDKAASKMELWRSVGLEPKVLDANGIVEVEPALESARHLYKGGIYSADDGSGDAHMFTSRLAEVCAEAGVAFRYETRVSAIGHADRRIAGVLTNAGRFQADAYVLALGAQSPLLVRPLGIKLPVYPGKGYSVTVPIEGHNGAPTVSLTDEALKVVFSKLGNRLRIAGTVELSGYDLSINEKRARATKAIMQGIFPNGGDYEKAHIWTGLRPMTPDSRPVIGRTPYENLYLNTGHGPLGWTMSFGSSKIVADLVSGETPDLDPAAYAFARF